jgi:hypothetical protein
MSDFDVKFSDMPEGKRAAWLRWANSHDWGGEAAYYTKAGNMTVSSLVIDNHGVRHIGFDFVTTPRELRNWAGY